MPKDFISAGGLRVSEPEPDLKACDHCGSQEEELYADSFTEKEYCEHCITECDNCGCDFYPDPDVHFDKAEDYCPECLLNMALDCFDAAGEMDLACRLILENHEVQKQMDIEWAFKSLWSAKFGHKFTLLKWGEPETVYGSRMIEVTKVAENDKRANVNLSLALLYFLGHTEIYEELEKERNKIR